MPETPSHTYTHFTLVTYDNGFFWGHQAVAEASSAAWVLPVPGSLLCSSFRLELGQMQKERSGRSGW
jgi:hypothetical protein